MSGDSSKREREIRCSFCGKRKDEVRKLIGGESEFICDQCVEVCWQVIEESTAGAVDQDSKAVPTPTELRAYLDDHVIGQDRAKKVLSVAVYNHYKRIGSQSKGDVDLEKSNILIVGPTGSGKTLMAKSLAAHLDVPFTIVDATGLTEAGYVGEDVENILVGLLQAADMDITKAERGIVYIDEIGKLARRSDSASITRDVSGEGVQQALLKLIEGTVAHVPPKGGRKHPQQEFVKLDTTHILFLCGGAFSGLEDIIKHRLGRRVIGYQVAPDAGVETEELEKEPFNFLDPEDLLKFGLIPELIGRLPVVTTLNELDEAAMIRILKEPKNALILQYQHLFEMDDIKLTFEDAALVAIAREALRQGSGARGLRAILERAMLPIMYDAPDDPTIAEVIVTEGVILDGDRPRILRKPARAS